MIPIMIPIRLIPIMIPIKAITTNPTSNMHHQHSKKYSNFFYYYQTILLLWTKVILEKSRGEVSLIEQDAIENVS